MLSVGKEHQEQLKSVGIKEKYYLLASFSLTPSFKSLFISKR